MQLTDVESEIRRGLEGHLAATVLATTGTITNVAVSPNKYTRTGGSFITDGFQVGDQVYVTGYDTASANGWAVATAVAATVLTVDRALPTEAAGDDILIKAVLPRNRRWPGQEFTIPSDKPWIRPTYRPGGMPVVAAGSGPYLRHFGLFIIDIFHPWDEGTGITRIERLARAVREQFKVTTSIVRGGMGGSGLIIRISGQQPGFLEEQADFLRMNPGIEYFADAIGGT